MDSVLTGGRRPRFFTLGPDDLQLYVANQDSDDITIFDLDPEAGSLTPTGARIGVGSPSAISFITS
jgi:6-phosphogluconolactonase (cycloisomerase 2 family)